VQSGGYRPGVGLVGRKPRHEGALNGSVDLRDAHVQLCGQLAVGRALAGMGDELEQDHQVLGLEGHRGEKMTKDSQFANRESRIKHPSPQGKSRPEPRALLRRELEVPGGAGPEGAPFHQHPVSNNVNAIHLQHLSPRVLLS